MAKSFKVIIVTPDKTAYEGDAVSATIPGLAGYIGIWANHAPLVAAVVALTLMGRGQLDAVVTLALGLALACAGAALSDAPLGDRPDRGRRRRPRETGSPRGARAFLPSTRRGLARRRRRGQRTAVPVG